MSYIDLVFRFQNPDQSIAKAKAKYPDLTLTILSKELQEDGYWVVIRFSSKDKTKVKAIEDWWLGEMQRLNATYH